MCWQGLCARLLGSHAIGRSLCRGEMGLCLGLRTLWSSAQITSSGPTHLQLQITATDGHRAEFSPGSALSHRELHLPKDSLLAND